MSIPRTVSLAILLAAFLGIFVPVTARAQTPAGDRYRISVVTMGPGDALFTRFGHIGILVEDRLEKSRVVYNYGTFSFEDPGLWINYARGFLNYWLDTNSWSGTQRYYRRVDRFLEQRVLRLSTERAEQLVKKLEVNALPENRYYAYRHYLDNCCTRIRDVLDDVTEGSLSRGLDQQPTGRTFRDWTRTALSGSPLMSSLILFSLGPAIDQPITKYDEQFLPENLARDLDAAQTEDGRPLVASEKRLIERQGADPRQTMVTHEVLILLGVAALLLFGFVPGLIWPRRGWARRATGLGLSLYGLILGLGGLILVVFWVATAHTDTHWNENLLVTPITHLWLMVPGARLLRRGDLPASTWRVVRWYIVAALGLLVFDLLMKLGPFIQGNYEFVAFAAVLGALALGVSWRLDVAPRPERG